MHFSTLAHFTYVNGNSLIRMENLEREATKGGVAAPLCKVSDCPAEGRVLFTFTKESMHLKHVRTCPEHPSERNGVQNFPFLLPDYPPQNNDETEGRNLKYAAVWILVSLCVCCSWFFSILTKMVRPVKCVR